MSAAQWGPFEVVFGGGGYFRLFPFQLISRLTTKADYVMTYFHPRDFDPEQPRIQGLSLLRRFKTYVGLDHSLLKLDRFLGTFGGQSLALAQEQVDWGRAPTIRSQSAPTAP